MAWKVPSSPIVLAVVAVLALPASSAADRSHASGKRDVPTAADRARARELLAEGNAALKASRFRPALALYRQALRHWDHPFLHYNASLALVQLDQPCELVHHLTQALALSRDGQGLPPGPLSTAHQLEDVARDFAAGCLASRSASPSGGP